MEKKQKQNKNKKTKTKQKQKNKKKQKKEKPNLIHYYKNCITKLLKKNKLLLQMFKNKLEII